MRKRQQVNNFTVAGRLAETAHASYIDKIFIFFNDTINEKYYFFTDKI